jgi:hypothetical protein
VKDELNIEWISPQEQNVDILIADALGKKVLETKLLSSAGLNRTIFKVSDLKSGIYLLLIKGGSVHKTQRIFIYGQN